ncbi:hypothetical protein A3F65_00720 [Candidatus Saccharibacteria bacterium RIFCSPHIGHO2_12_FULL_47_16b]|nr:MAG: hypothetical protein A3F65_00720 [Candidatus Saccharibacteria bacterium RIFCSPHIGHO2_12_FULL_47_16b]
MSRLARPDLVKRFVRSIWFFPAILALPLIVFTALQIHGSSIGTYYKLFYGDSSSDPDIVLNRPQGIRSDEWLVNTQLTIAQKNNGYERINQNIGNGEDVSLTGEAPYKEWSTLFKPHNWAFFALPFDNAFAFRWWLMGYLLIVSCYFFILALFPGKRLFAALVGLSVFFTPFVQWWYLYGTLGTLFYAFFGGVVFIKLINEKRRLQRILWALLLAYIITCFALILYPPFQIPVALAMLVFGLGYCLDKMRGLNWRAIWQRLAPIIGAVVIAAGITLSFLGTRSEVVQIIRNTTYPGKRIQASGGFDAGHLFSSHLGAQFQFASKSRHYQIPKSGLMNQSESSNFILLFPFLLLPSFYLLYRSLKHERKFDWPLAVVNGAILVMLAWLFIPNLGLIGKLTLLEMVQHQRLIIGLGVLNIVQLVLVVRHLVKSKYSVIKNSWVLIFTATIFLIELGLGLYARDRFPGFIDIFRVIGFAVPIPLIMYFLLRKRFEWAGAVLLLFGLAMTFRINPLYQGTAILTETPLSKSIARLDNNDDSKWVIENFILENFALMNGAASLSGLYTYPQKEIWRGLNPEVPEEIYNRYAHTSFSFDRNPSVNIPTSLKLGGIDKIDITTEPCSDFLKGQNVRYLLASAELNPSDSCASLAERVDYPAITFFIYRLNY